MTEKIHINSLLKYGKLVLTTFFLTDLILYISLPKLG